MKFLIVDDDEKTLYLLKVFLEKSGYEVLSAVNGAEALEKARSNPPDMIVTDILMPVMDGFTLCREWKRNDRLKEIPFIFYTATYTDSKDEEFALSLGAKRFIRKPEEPGLFLQILQEVLKEKNACRLVASPMPVEEEEVSFKEYSEVLIRKLETKMLQLEEANRALDREITERKQVEEILRESEERSRALVESSLGHIFLLDQNGTYLVSNNRVSQFGLERGKSMVGCHLRDVYPQRRLSSISGNWNRFLQRANRWNSSIPCPNPTASTITLTPSTPYIVYTLPIHELKKGVKLGDTFG